VVERGLGRGGEDNRTTQHFVKLLEHRAGRREKGRRDVLALIQKNHTPGDVMELPASSGLVGEQALKEHNIRCDHDRGVPVFRAAGCVFEPGQFSSIARLRKPTQVDKAVMFEQGIVVSSESQGLANRLGILVQDAEIGDDIDNPTEVIGFRMGEREGQS
jgi:hypothetical protein